MAGGVKFPEVIVPRTPGGNDLRLFPYAPGEPVAGDPDRFPDVIVGGVERVGEPQDAPAEDFFQEPLALPYLPGQSLR